MKSWKTKSGYEIIRILSGRSNVFLLTNGQKNVLIDSSVSRLWKKLVKKLDKLGIHSIDYLILTHAHFDHAGNANQIQKKFDAFVIIQKEEAPCLSNGDNILPGGTTIFTRPIMNLFGKRLFSRFKYKPCKCNLMVDSCLDLKAFGFNAYLMHTPGHTIGSMSLIVDDEIAIVGDSMFGVFKWSVFPPFAENAEQMIKSWGKLLATNCTWFIPSHGNANNRLSVESDYKKRIKNTLHYK
ncbi:MAG TPA: MBL fold metallo-hydrolase [Bacteroidales bacterium]|nr:MBL fold metallo-hydrolase [Bacteroidales bacterium]